ncbi:MAG: MBL fold metallo-hydrolase [Lachnospiraceae bacterium]|nr:MBL fold metallo-hydrolase [Lachnospiraceae bacterium]
MLREALRAPLEWKPRLFFLGQAGFALQNSRGKWLLVDPYLSDCVRKLEGHEGYKRLFFPPVGPGEMPADVIVATHHHYDHYDKDSMPFLMRPGTRLFAPRDCEELVRQNGLNPQQVGYVAPGCREEAAGFSLHFISCDHGEGAPLAVGLIVSFDGFRLLFVGDSCFRQDYLTEYLSEGTPDVMAAPINGAYGNLDWQECARLGALVRPKLLIPCHFGLFASHGGRPDLFYEEMTRHFPEQPFLMMAPGEEWVLR